MDIDRVGLEMAGEGSQGELVKNTANGEYAAEKRFDRGYSPALIDVHVILHFRVAPIREVLRVIVNLKHVRTPEILNGPKKYSYGVESVPTDEGDGVGQNRTADGVARADAHPGRHGFFGIFGDETGVHLDKVRVFVQMSELIRHPLRTG